jgi:hypothetical protein
MFFLSFFFFCIWYVYMILFRIVYWKTCQWTKNFMHSVVYSGSLFSIYIWACWIIHIGSCKCASVHDIEVCLNISGRSSRECRKRVWRGVEGTIWGQWPWASQLCFWVIFFNFWPEIGSQFWQKQKGTMGLIEINNPNLVKPKNLKAKMLM